MKIRLLKSYKYFRKRYKPILGLLQKASFLSFFRTIMSNVIMEIKHIHIRIEYSPKINLDSINPDTFSKPINDKKHANTVLPDDNDDNTYDNQKSKQKNINIFKKLHNDDDDNDYSNNESNEYSSDEDISPSTRFAMYEQFNQENNESNDKVSAIGIIMKKLVIQNPENYEVISNEKIVKNIIFSDLAVYMDVDQISVNLSTKDSFISHMDNFYDSNDHNWILKPFSFSSLIKYEKDSPVLLIEAIMKKILINIKEEYIPLLIELLKIFDTFKKVLSVAHIPKPSLKCPQSFWIYIHQCALTKISNPCYEFSQGLCLLIKRIIFIRNHKKKNKKSLDVIKKMEETLDYSTIVAFRAAYRLSHRKKKVKGKAKITSKTTDKIINEIKIDPTYLVTAMIGMLSINMKSELIKISLNRSIGGQHIVVNIKNLNMIFEKDLRSYQICTTISNITSFYINGNDKYIVFKSVDNTLSEMQIKMAVPFHSYSNLSASFYASKNNYTINLKWLFQIVADLSHLSFYESTMNINNIIEFVKRRKLQLIIQMNSSEIKIIGSKSTCAIEYAFDKLSLLTDTKAQKGSFNLNNSWISFITTQAIKVSSDFSIIGSMKDKNISITIPLFSCSIPFQYIVVIQDFIDLFLQYQDLIKVDKLPKIDINTKLDMKGIDININLHKQKNHQIRHIKLKSIKKNSVLKCKIKSIKMEKILSLRNLKVRFDRKSLIVKLQYVSAKVIDLIELIPQNKMFQKQNETPSNNEKIEELSSCESNTEIEEETSTYISVMKKPRKIELPKIKIGCKVDTLKLNLNMTNDIDVKFSIKDINADINQNKIIANTLLDKIKIEHQIIAKPILFQSEITLGQNIEIMIKTDSFDININKNMIYSLLTLKFGTPKVILPPDFGMKIVFVLNQMTISNDFNIKHLQIDITIHNYKIDGILFIDSIDSSFCKFKSNELVQLKADIIEKSLDLIINMKKITIFVIPLIDLISSSIR